MIPDLLSVYHFSDLLDHNQILLLSHEQRGAWQKPWDSASISNTELNSKTTEITLVTEKSVGPGL